MKKLLVVVDMQNDFIDGSLGTAEAVAIVPNVVAKINNWDGDIITTQDTHFNNYMDVFRMEGMLSSTLVSVARTVLGTLLMLACTCFLGYAFSRKEYWHKKLFYRYVIVTMYFSAGMVPGFINMGA